MQKHAEVIEYGEVAGRTPEKNLLIAIICRALADIPDANHRESALLFLRSDCFAIFCEILELNCSVFAKTIKTTSLKDLADLLHKVGFKYGRRTGRLSKKSA